MHVVDGPLGEGGRDLTDLETEGGQLILDLRRDGRVHGPANESVAFE